MNFDWKLLLSEVEVLQLAPLEHLRYEKHSLQSRSHKILLHMKVHAPDLLWVKKGTKLGESRGEKKRNEKS